MTVDDLLGESERSVESLGQLADLLGYGERRGSRVGFELGTRTSSFSFLWTAQDRCPKCRRSQGRGRRRFQDLPGSNDLEVVLDSLVVDESTLLEVAHLDLLVSDSGLDSGHGSGDGGSRGASDGTSEERGGGDETGGHFGLGNFPS